MVGAGLEHRPILRTGCEAGPIPAAGPRTRFPLGGWRTDALRLHQDGEAELDSRLDSAPRFTGWALVGHRVAGVAGGLRRFSTGRISGIYAGRRRRAQRGRRGLLAGGTAPALN